MTYRPKYPPGTWDPRAPRPQACGPRPHVWKSGPDPEEHKKYKIFIQQKNQAQWREEPWLITFEEWKQLWDESGQWDNRGRERSCFCMTRRDVTEPWTKNNATVISREEHSRKQSLLQATGYRSIAQQKRRIRLGLPDQPLNKTKRKPR